MSSHREQARPRRCYQMVGGALAALAAIGLVLQARAGAQSASSSSLLASTAAAVAQDLREAEDTARMSPEELGREAGRSHRRGAPSRRAPAAQPVEPVQNLAAEAAERRAVRQKRKAEAGLAERRSLVKALQAQRRVSQMRLNTALSTMAFDADSAAGLPPALAPASSAAAARRRSRNSVVDAEEAKRERAAVWSPPQTLIDGFGDTAIKETKHEQTAAWSPPQTTAHTAAASTDPDTVSEDQKKLRASNSSLYADAVSAPPGALARAKWLAAAQQKKEKPASDGVATELAGVQKEVESLKQLLAKAELAKMPSPPPEHERLAADKISKDGKGLAALRTELESFMQELAQQEELAAVQTEMESFKHELAQMLGFSGDQKINLPKPRKRVQDRAHCVHPYVWVDGSCKASPRGRKERYKGEARACAGGENTPACKQFMKNERKEEEEYDRDLKKNGGYEYNTDRPGRREYSGSSPRNSGSSPRIRREGDVGDGAGKNRLKGNVSENKGARRMGSLEDDLDRFMGNGKHGRGKNLPGANDDAISQNHKDGRKIDGLSDDAIRKLAKEIKTLDEWTKNGGVEPYEFIPTPQRFPHRDGADLGDNYMGSFSDKHGEYPDKEVFDDKIVLPKEAAMRQPSELTTFFGKGERQRQVPLSRRSERLALDNGKAAITQFMQDKFGFPVDVYPSNRQMQQQVERTLTTPEMSNVQALRHDPWESPNIQQRWRKDPDCVGTSCSWRPVLEDKDKKCDAKDCSETCKGDQCGEKLPSVEVCGPLGCRKTTPVTHQPAPLKEQLSKGGLDGQADPFGAEAMFGDLRAPAVAAALDIGLRAHFRSNSGEPIGDAAMRGWQMHNGIDYEAGGGTQSEKTKAGATELGTEADPGGEDDY